MDSSEYRPKKELKGSRPECLRVSRDSCAIQKPRPPIIIYTQSPKIIHAKPEEFMMLVQRLTGKQQAKESGKILCPPVEPPDHCGEDFAGRRPPTDGETGGPAADNIFPSLPSYDPVSADMFHSFTPEFECRDVDFSDVNLGQTSISPHLTFPGQTHMGIPDDFFDL